MTRTNTLLAVLLLTACTSAPEADSSAQAGKEGATATAQAVPAAASSAFKIRPGEWETSVEVTSLAIEGAPKGMPPGLLDQMKPARTVVKSCVSPQEAEKPRANMLAAQEAANCSSSRAEFVGGRISVAMSCKQPGQPGSSDIKMSGRYDDNSYEMDGDMTVSGPQGMTMAMKTHTTGRRLGDCKG
jgi:hypothetical protein